MAKATFHSFRGEKSALVLIKPNAFVYSATPVYIPKSAVREDIKQGDVIDIPDGYKFADFIDPETGDVRTTEAGEALKVLAY